MKFTSLIFALVVGVCSADVPDGMTYQGVLTDNAGALIASATPENREIEFRVYSQASGGDALWGERQTVTVFKGNFSVVLGNGVTLGGGVASGKPALAAAFANGSSTNFFFGITPVGGAEFVPRQGILSNAFAFRAKVADSVNGDFLKTASGRLGVGLGAAATPEAVLHTGGKIFVENLVTGAPINGRTGGGGAKLVLWPGSSTSTAYGFGIADGSLWSGVPSGSKYQWFFGESEVMSLSPGVFFGPVLSLKGSIFSEGFISSEGGLLSNSVILAAGDITVNSDDDANGGINFGNGPGERIRSVATSNDLRFSTSGSERMTIASNGNVGIGASPSKGKLHVQGWGDFFQTSFAYYSRSASGQPFTGQAGGSVRYSIWASSRVGGAEFNAFSDERIKKIAGLSDGASDLAVLQQIEVTDYTMKDVVAHGKGTKKKVIAQQVEKVYPKAVSRSTNTVPDLYQVAGVKDGWIELETDLIRGEKVRLIYGKAGDGIYKVTEVEEKRFKTDLASTSELKEVFVFGREVKDFRSVDYNAISMLNVSATQEIYREVTDLKAKVAGLELREKARDAKIEALEKSLLSLILDKKSGE